MILLMQNSLDYVASFLNLSISFHVKLCSWTSIRKLESPMDARYIRSSWCFVVFRTLRTKYIV